MSYMFGTHSEKNLKGVHPDLCKVVRHALELSEVDFGITQGKRTMEQQLEMVNAGTSTTTNSRHIPANNECGVACAIDVMAYAGGSGTWEWRFYQKIAKAMFSAAIELGVQIEWGGHWSKPKDGPHYQLTWRHYP